MSTGLVQRASERCPEMNMEEIRSIRDWLNDQSHLPSQWITDFDIIMAHYSCGRHVQRTKIVIDLHYTLRTMCTFYQHRTIDTSLEVAFRTWLMTPLKTPTKAGNRIIYCQLMDHDINNFNYSDVVRAFVMLMDVWQHEEGPMDGVAVVVNMDGVALGHLARIHLTTAQQFFYFIQEAMFVLLREFHFINAPSVIDTLMSMIRPFMKPELQNIVKVHKVGTKSIHQFIPTKALPSDAGGGLEDSCSILREKVWKKILENHNFFEDEKKKRVDESKRKQGPCTISTFFNCLEESFNNLEID